MVTQSIDPDIARSLWRVIEPTHQLAYRSPEAAESLASVGLDRPELQYFGGRLAAMGPIGAELATAVLFGFSPTYIARAVPEVWTRASPAAISDARKMGAARTLARVVPDHLRAAIDEAADSGAQRLRKPPTSPGARWQRPTSGSGGPTIRRWCCGTPAPSCASTEAMPTGPSRRPTGSTRSSAMSSTPPTATCPTTCCSGSRAGTTRPGRVHGIGSGPEDSSTVLRPPSRDRT